MTKRNETTIGILNGYGNELYRATLGKGASHLTCPPSPRDLSHSYLLIVGQTYD